MKLKTGNNNQNSNQLTFSIRQLIVFFSVLAVLFTVLSSLNVFKNTIHADILRYILWAAMAGCVVLKGKFAWTEYSKLHIAFLMYCILSYFILSIKNNGDVSTSYIGVVLLSCFVYLVTYNILIYSGLSIIRYWIFAYAIGIVICSFVILANYDFASWLSSNTYIFDIGSHKNSMGQLLGVGLILIFIYVQPQKIFFKILKILALLVILLSMVFVQCRSALVACAVVVFIYVILYSKRRWLYCALVLIALIVLLNNDAFVTILQHAFYTDKYTTSSGLDLNLFSSGRFDLYKLALSEFGDNFILGTQNYYVDNFVINLLVNTGCIGAIICIPTLAYRFYSNFKTSFKRLKKNDVLKNTVFSISVFSLVISFFEGYPPFGPGTTSMMFWMICAIADYCRYYGDEYEDGLVLE